MTGSGTQWYNSTMIERESVKLKVANKRRLQALKEHPRETIDDVLDRLLTEAERRAAQADKAVRKAS